jgi:hypothetical protein
MAALETLLGSTLSSDWQVVYGSRKAVTVTQNYVAVIRGAAGTDETTQLSVDRSHERYTVRLELSGSIAGAGEETMQTVTVAVFAAKTAVEQAVREYPDGRLGLGPQGVLRVTPSFDWEFTPAADATVREAVIDCGFDIIAQNS